jgi:hypothetical protein
LVRKLESFYQELKVLIGRVYMIIPVKLFNTIPEPMIEDLGVERIMSLRMALVRIRVHF